MSSFYFLSSQRDAFYDTILIVLDTVSKPPPHAVFEDDNVMYRQERYGGEMLLDVTRHKGSTGVIKLMWGAAIEPQVPASFIMSPMYGVLEFKEGQWNSSIHLEFSSIPDTNQEIEVIVKLINVSGGAMLGNFTTVKVTFPSKQVRKTDPIWKIILPCLSGALLIVGITAAVVFLCKGRGR